MDLSDDIAYSVHDFEDAIVNGYLDPARLADTPGALGAADRDPGLGRLRLRARRARGRALPAHAPAGMDRLLRRHARRARPSQEPHLRPDRPLRPRRDDGDARGLRHLGAHPVPCACGGSARGRGRDGGAQGHHRRRRGLDRGPQEPLQGAAPRCSRGSRPRCGNDPTRSMPMHAQDFAAAETDAARRRVVVDQVASLTDQHAIAWHGRLVGEVDAASVGVWAPGRAAPGTLRGSRRRARGR